MAVRHPKSAAATCCADGTIRCPDDEPLARAYHHQPVTPRPFTNRIQPSCKYGTTTPMGPLALLVSGFLAQPVTIPPARQEPSEQQAETSKGPRWTPPTVHVLTMFSVVRATEALLWPDPFAETDPAIWGQHYKEAWTRPPIFEPSRPAFSWDGDRWEINVIGHGLMGSEAYLRARQCKFGWLGALAFTAGSTVVWEYGFEANGVRPSAQDLVYTPISGLALGEARFVLWKSASQISHPTLRSVLRGLVDPFGELSRGTSIFDC
ncbi:MAG: hypothetical protein BWY17_03541 [Deltaproteobacteria bacterium ADurb.Bin207]|nr:MAG: hypothetical protein BWY17_03541 [Deltaproteobacteria bacterium ADurb.Bin207]